MGVSPQETEEVPAKKAKLDDDYHAQSIKTKGDDISIDFIWSF